MKYLAIILVAVLAILIVVFISWFLNMKANGKCPLCALKKIFIPTKLTIDISEDEEYSENKVAQTPPMGWSSWNTFRNNIDQDIIMQTAHAMKDSGLANAGGQFAFGNSVYVSTGHGIQLVVYRQCVTVHDARHSFLRNKTVVSQAEHDVVEASTG